MPGREREGPSILSCFSCRGDEGDLGGMPKPRGCTDTAWLVLFAIFCAIMILIGAFALVYGNPHRLINGMDSFGNVCGTPNEKLGSLNYSGLDMSDRPFLFFFNLRDMENSMRICVSECPPQQIRNMEELTAFHENSTVSLCRYDFNVSEWALPSDKEADKGSYREEEVLCPKFPIYASHPVLKRCVPKAEPDPGSDPKFFFKPNVNLFALVYGYLNRIDLFQQVLGDLAVTWVQVLGLTAVAFVISLLLVFILHWMTTVVAYLILILSALLSLLFTGFLWWTYLDLKRTLDLTSEDLVLAEMRRNECSFLTYSIIATIFTVILLLVIFVVRRRVTIVVRLFQEAGSAMLSMPCLWLQPFITYLALFGFFCCWLYIVLCIATSDYARKRHISNLGDLPLIAAELDSAFSFPENSSATPSDFVADLSGVKVERGNKSYGWNDLPGWTIVEYSDEAWVKYMWFVYLFGLIWCSEFILACQQMVIASSVASWYFSRARGSLRCIVLNSVTRMVQYHIGSIALGSLVITFIKLPRLVLQFTQKVLRKWEEYSFIKCMSRCCICCLRSFESCMKYVHHNAYTVISIQGVNFCPASRLAYSALIQNALQISVVNSIGDFILFLAKCITAAATGLIALAIFRSDESLYYYAIPVLLTVVLSYFVAHCVISVFEMTVDTLFLCFCEDHNMNDGTDGKEFYAPRSLLQYMTIDAVDAVSPGRRSHLESPSHLKTQMAELKETASPEEIIPMNPYHGTTVPNE